MSLTPEMWQEWNCLWPERLHVFTCLRAFKITETSGDVLSINITLSQDLAGCGLLTYFKQRWLQSLWVLPLFPNNYLLPVLFPFQCLCCTWCLICSYWLQQAISTCTHKGLSAPSTAGYFHLNAPLKHKMWRSPNVWRFHWKILNSLADRIAPEMFLKVR